MSHTPHRIRACVVTGMGAVSSLGRGCDALWEALCAGRDGMGPVARFSTAELSVHLGAEVPRSVDLASAEGRVVAYGLAAAREAWEQARVSAAALPAARLALVLGTSLGHHRAGLHHPAEALGARLGIEGPCLTVSTACASSNNALGLGRDLLASGTADLVLAGGADELSPELFAGFHALGVLSAHKCAPFSEPVGTTLGEGAGFLVLESPTLAEARGARPLAALRGYGLASDAHHETAPDPTGGGVARCMRSALADAGLSGPEVGYVNVHGTGTAANDPAEWRALQRVFGDAPSPAFSSTKSFLGHAQGAAGVLEAITTILALRHQQVPPTLHYAGPRHGCPADPVAGEAPRAWPHDHALCTNSAFGGANAAVVLSREPPPPNPRPHSADVEAPRPVRLLGLGAVAAHGTELEELADALARGKPLGGRVPALAPASIPRSVNPRGMDPATRYLTVAAARALADAGVRVRGALRERAGILVGATSVSTQSAREFLTSISERGLARVSATAFAKMVLNASAGAASMHLSLRGPITALTVGQGSGLVAVAYGAHLLATRGDADLLLCGGVDELGRASLGGLTEAEAPGSPAAPGSLEPAEGAGLLLLGAGDIGARATHPEVILAGWGLSGATHPAAAVAQALTRAGRRPQEVDLLYGHADEARMRAALAPCWPAQGWRDPAAVLGLAPAAGEALSCVAAGLALRRSEARTALVLSIHQGAACGAILLTRGATHGT